MAEVEPLRRRRVENLGGWLTTVMSRVCLDMLRSRKARREIILDEPAEPASRDNSSPAPEDEAVLADSIGIAMMVVLEALNPAERLTFVLHDMFGMPFDEIAPIVGRSPAATRQLASRARRRSEVHPPIIRRAGTHVGWSTRSSSPHAKEGSTTCSRFSIRT